MRLFKHKIILFLILNIPLCLAAGHIKDTLKPARRPYFIGLPIFYYTPDTRWGFGAAMNYSFYTDSLCTKKSNVSLGTSYTQNKQIALYIPFQLFFKQDQWWLYGELGYYDYLFYYFGVGKYTRIEPVERYQVRFPRIRMNTLKQIGKYEYAGLRYVFDRFSYTRYDSNGELLQGIVEGSKNGTVSGVGLVFNRDSRDNIQYPSKGSLLESMLYFEGKWSGSSFSYNRLSVDYARYIPLKWRKSVWVVQGMIILMTGEVPFHQMATLGGTKRLRGYFDGRFRNRNMELLQTEFRTPLFWRFKAAVFAGLGNVHSDHRDILANTFVYHAGVGLRVELDRSQKLHLRLDYGMGKDERGFYLTLGEAF